MRTFARTTTFLSFAALIILFVSGCDNPKTGSIYDPNVTFRLQPTIASVSPPVSPTPFAGMDTMVITGTNFSSVLAEDNVLFNSTQAALLKATTTKITLVAPMLPAPFPDSIAIRVSVFGSDMFSNAVQYKLKEGVVTFGKLITGELASSVTTDAAGNIYSGYSASAIEAGILKITPAGVRSSYAPGTAGVAAWSSFKMGPGGYVYGARNVRAIYRYSPGGGSSAVLWQQIIGTTLSDLDFDQSGNAWVGGNNSNVYRIAQDKTVSSY
ncbi:MAG: IPT/TIG domain-containing protein, partial [Ignavibacteriales bacterium]|nr:IPT/TIG domain-containing protein [Ignavibacteriales bacterium]